MNRSLVIPAGCCLFAFAALLTALHGVAGRENAAETARFDASERREDRGTMPATSAHPLPEAASAKGNLLLSRKEAEQVLTKLSGEYLRPWRQWETSPRHLYSRAAPRPIPTISAKIEMSSLAGQNDSFLVATIAVSAGERSWSVPCVVDRMTKKVRLFAGGQWLTADEWLKQAPLPGSTKF